MTIYLAVCLWLALFFLSGILFLYLAQVLIRSLSGPFSTADRS